MTNEEKLALIEGCTQRVDALSKYCRVNPDEREASLDLSLCKIALAALTAQPVKLPHKWVYIRFTDRSKSQRMKCQVAWSDSLNSVIYDEEGAPLLISNSAYEVQE